MAVVEEEQETSEAKVSTRRRAEEETILRVISRILCWRRNLKANHSWPHMHK